MYDRILFVFYTVFFFPEKRSTLTIAVFTDSNPLPLITDPTEIYVNSSVLEYRDNIIY